MLFIQNIFIEQLLLYIGSALDLGGNLWLLEGTFQCEKILSNLNKNIISYSYIIDGQKCYGEE